MATVCTVTSTLLQSSSGITEGQWDVKGSTHYQSKHLSSKELLRESKLTVHKALAGSVERKGGDSHLISTRTIQ